MNGQTSFLALAVAWSLAGSQTATGNCGSCTTLIFMPDLWGQYPITWAQAYQKLMVEQQTELTAVIRHAQCWTALDRSHQHWTTTHPSLHPMTDSCNRNKTHCCCADAKQIKHNNQSINQSTNQSINQSVNQCAFSYRLQQSMDRSA